MATQDTTVKAFVGLPIEDLICAPILGAAKGQRALAQETLSFVNDLAFLPKDNDDGSKNANIIDVSFNRLTNSSTTGQVAHVNQKIQMPMISLVNIPNFAMDSLITAFILGARIIEKHFTYDKTLMGNDHYHAMDINDLINFKRRLKSINTILGVEIDKRPIASEEISRKNARRSIVAKQKISPGEIITLEKIDFQRPGNLGISASEGFKILNKKSNSLIKKGMIIKKNMLK